MSTHIPSAALGRMVRSSGKYWKVSASLAPHGLHSCSCIPAVMDAPGTSTQKAVPAKPMLPAGVPAVEDGAASELGGDDVLLQAAQLEEHEAAPSLYVILHIDAPAPDAQQYPNMVCILPLEHTASVSAHAGKSPSVEDGRTAAPISCTRTHRQTTNASATHGGTLGLRVHRAAETDSCN